MNAQREIPKTVALDISLAAITRQNPVSVTPSSHAPPTKPGLRMNASEGNDGKTDGAARPQTATSHAIAMGSCQQALKALMHSKISKGVKLDKFGCTERDAIVVLVVIGEVTNDPEKGESLRLIATETV